MRIKITKRSVEAIRPADRPVRAYDTELQGFGVKVLPNSRRVYFVRAQKDGRRHFATIGPHGPITAEQAREKARTVLGAIAAGTDVTAEREAAKQQTAEPTVEELGERCIREHVELRCKASTSVKYRRHLEKFIVPAIGQLVVRDIGREDIATLHHSMRKTPYEANRVRALLSLMMNLAERWGLRPGGTNPCRFVDRYPEKSRQRFLSATETARLGAALDEAERTQSSSRHAVAALRLLLFTGARLREITLLRWDEVDFERSELRLLDSKTGKKTLYLNAVALEILRGLEHDRGDSPWVIRGTKDGQPITYLHSSWHRIQKAAGLEDVRIHDLRHSLATFANSAGVPIAILGKLLGHKHVATTETYAHLFDDPVREAAEAIGETITEAIRTGQRRMYAVK